MSTKPRLLPQLTTQIPIGLIHGEPTLKSAQPISGTRRESRIHDLGIILERLFCFYEAMRIGKPVADADQKLAEVGSALARSMKNRNAL